MEFWNSKLTEKSWESLLKLNKFKFILIGGWAAYLWTNLHKSKDIDIVIKNLEDLALIRKEYNLLKNDNLKKYEIKMEEIDIDIYVPFFSRLTIPVDKIRKYTTIIQGFEVVKPEILLILKQGAESDREKTVKGEKDRLDIITLLFNTDIDFKIYFDLLRKYKIEHFYERLRNIITNFKEIKYLGINPRQLKLKKQNLIKELKQH